MIGNKNESIRSSPMNSIGGQPATMSGVNEAQMLESEEYFE